jgi:RNA recognition motif-containing protein
MSSNTRLFVGNLPETVDEYALVQLLSKHGKIAKLDFLFHKAGPRKGKPRGYAFVEYATKEVGIYLL